jgi:two-component system, sensor histidine kinase PdtaS
VRTGQSEHGVDAVCARGGDGLDAAVDWLCWNTWPQAQRLTVGVVGQGTVLNEEGGSANHQRHGKNGSNDGDNCLIIHGSKPSAWLRRPRASMPTPGMRTWERIAAERGDLGSEEISRLRSLVETWDVVADLSLADLVLWLPTWNNAGFVAAALTRPTTAPTSVPGEIVGQFRPRRRSGELHRAMRGPVEADAALPNLIAVPGTGTEPIAVIERYPSVRRGGAIDEVYVEIARVLFAMIEQGTFPPDPLPVLGAGDVPRVGDGVLRVDADGLVTFASPNAMSTFRRLGLATELLGADLARTVARLVRRPGPMMESLTLVAAGRIAGDAELINDSASVVLRGWPLLNDDNAIGALILAADVTASRHRERDLLSKESALREVHHRVKNNLQTVSALLRMQSRRVQAPEAQAALAEAGRRVAAIAAVHDILSVEPGDFVNLDEVLIRLAQLTADVVPGPRTGHAPPAITVSTELGSVPTDTAGPLAMAVSELLANAAEHSGATTIEVTGAITAGTSPQLTITVSDDGSGFDLSAPGGLGLSIVRTVIEEDLRGRLLQVDAAETGSRVRVQVPV